MIKAILFDWGDTVMEELGGTSGPMAGWKQVAATPGIPELLASLDGRYDICLATNASESDQGLVRRALVRVGLDGYFSRVYTARDVGCSKPTPEYYTHIVSDLGIRADECLMVGNGLETDANGAALAGLRAIWLMREPESLRSHPMFDAVISDYSQFNTAFAEIQDASIPGFSACLGLLKHAGVRPGLFRHLQKVALTGFVLASRLLQQGVAVNPILVHRAGLLHDIDKPSLTEDRTIHGQLGAQMVAQAGFGVLSPIIRPHQVLSILADETAPKGWEARLVYLADKLVEKDRLVGAAARMDHLMDRYNQPEGQMERCKPLVLQMEREVSQLAGIQPEYLLDYLHRAVDGVDVETIHL